MRGLFPPAQVAALRDTLAQAPPVIEALQPAPARWSLAAIKAVCTWLAGYSLAGIWRVVT